MHSFQSKTKINRWGFLALPALLMCIASIAGVFLVVKPTTIRAADTPCSATTQTDIVNCIASANATAGNSDTTTITIQNSIDFNGIITIAANKNIIITSADPANATLNRTAPTNNIITVAAAASLTLHDIIINGTAANGNSPILSAQGGTLNLDSGTIIQGQTNTGAGSGVISGTSGAMINVKPGSIIRNNDAGTGSPGAITANGSTATPVVINMTGGEIYGNVSGGVGGAMRLENNVQFNFSGGTIGSSAPGQGNIAVTNGGAIYIASNATYRAALNITGGEIIGNTAGSSTINGNGGAIYIGNYADINISGGNISSNSASLNGGAIYANGNAIDFTMSGGTISNNIAGGVNTNSGGGGIRIEGYRSVNITGGTISGNKVQPGGSGKTGIGGGLYLSSGVAGSDAKISGVTFDGNQVFDSGATGSSGGGVYINSAYLTKFEDNIISNNSSTGAYGGAYVTSAGLTSVSNLTISDNFATGNYGGARIDGANIATVSDIVVTDNTSNAQVGGFGLTNMGSLTAVNNITATGNQSATGHSGVNISNLAKDLTISNVTLTGNTVTTSNYGGGLSLTTNGATGALRKVRIENSNISDNTVMGRGGGVWVVDYYDLTIHDTTIKNNQANTHGGGVAMNANSRLTLSGNTEISGNSAGEMAGGADVLDANATLAVGGNGGGITMGNGSAADPSQLTIRDNAKVNNNTATANGGGLYVGGNLLAVTIRDNAQINGNKARQDGGGLYVGAGRSATDMNEVRISGDAQIMNNQAGRNYGGAFFGNNIDLLMSGNARVDGNKSGQVINGGGGGMSIGAPSVVRLQDSVSVSNNETGKMAAGDNLLDPSATPVTTGGNGGFSMANGMAALGNTLTITDNVKINNNKVAGTVGGVSVGRFTTVTLSGDGEINGNMARGNYGGLYLSGSTDPLVTMTTTISDNFSISGNSAGGNGGGLASMGAIYVLNISDNVSISNNTAGGQGGGIITGNSVGGNQGFTYISDNVTIDGNTAGTNGGGIVVDNGSWLEMSGGRITNNTAAGAGGGIRQGTVEGKIVISGGEITDNSAGQGGGISTYLFYDTAYFGNELLISGGLIARNRAVTDGGGIADIGKLTEPYDRNGRMEISGSAVIRDNIAGVNGGGVFVPYLQLTQLDVGAGVTFAANTAADYESNVAPTDLPTYNAHISVPDNMWSTSPDGVFRRGYNNYDIAYSAVKFSAIFDSAGGSNVASQTVYHGDSATRPSDPTRDGYVFKGWCVGDCAPKGYKTIESVEFTGADWVNTGIKTSDDLEVVLDYRFNTNDADPSKNAVIYGARSSIDLNHFDLLQYTCGDLRIAFGTHSYGIHQNISCADPSGFFTNNDRVTVRQEAGDFWYGSQQLTATADFTNGQMNMPLDLYLGALNNNGAVVMSGANVFSFDVYNFRIYQGGDLVANYLPMERESDGVVGFYDTVSKKFLARPASGGAFDRVSVGADGLDCVDTGVEWDFNTVLANDLHLVARWEKIPDVPGVPGAPNTGFSATVGILAAGLATICAALACFSVWRLRQKRAKITSV
ncbi:MAG: right-handed parallel beta-helix repeat-containing protein [Candidatus Nomurabacteria bacterium]|nr:right-handed parallel beta-helix repeat-containing protein [Candidatus Nomurabacteria bacterium]